MERKIDFHCINEAFVFNGATLIVRQADVASCKDCYFRYHDCGDIPCMSINRYDRRSVYFEEKGGLDGIPFHNIDETFEYRGMVFEVKKNDALGSHCMKCFFSGRGCSAIPCTKERRRDRQSVYFVRIDKE